MCIIACANTFKKCTMYCHEYLYPNYKAKTNKQWSKNIKFLKHKCPSMLTYNFSEFVATHIPI